MLIFKCSVDIYGEPRSKIYMEYLLPKVNTMNFIVPKEKDHKFSFAIFNMIATITYSNCQVKIIGAKN